MPAFEAEPTAEDAITQAARATKLSSLSLAPVQHSSALARLPHIGTYEVDANDLGIESIALDFAQAECVVTFKTRGGAETLRCGYGGWQPGQTNLFNHFNGPWLSDDPTLVVTSGGWTNQDCFTMVVRLIETPFFYRLAYHFIGDELLVEMRVNITLDVPRTFLLTAHLAASTVPLRA